MSNEPNIIQSQKTIYTHITTLKQSSSSSFTSKLTVLRSTINALHQFYSFFSSSRTIFIMRRRNKISCLMYTSILYIPKFAKTLSKLAGVGLENVAQK